ncbi:MAG: DUF6288 domain-containing protein [Lentisphaerales bacterium]|nr:DUF6288 domain-containing protein [Lentisphaerales bacterium]
MWKNSLRVMRTLCVAAFFCWGSLQAELIQEQEKRLESYLPASGYEKMAIQRPHSLGGMSSTKDELNSLPFNLGPTGIMAERSTNHLEYTVIGVSSDSPAEGKIKKGDIIYGVNGKAFVAASADDEFARRQPNPQFGNAIEISESRQDGQLELLIKREAKKLKITITLKYMGRFGALPAYSPKAAYLSELNAKILIAKQLPDGMWGNGMSGKKKASHYASCLAALALMSTGNSAYEKAVHRAFNTLVKADSKGFATWFTSYQAVFLGEYYLRYGDERSLEKLNKIVARVADGSFYYNGMHGYGHNFITGNYRYGGINACTAHAAMTLAIAKVCGLSIPKGMGRKMAMTIERLAPDGPMSYGWTAREKGEFGKKKLNEHSGRTGIGAMAHRILGGRPEHSDKMTDFLFYNHEYTDCGHSSGGSMSWLWGSLGIGFGNEKLFAEHMKKRLWYFNFNRQFDGGFYAQPSPYTQFRPADTILGPHFIAATNILLFNWHKHNLLITGKKVKSPASRAYTQSVLPASDYFERQDRIVEVAEVAALLKKKTPKSVAALFKKLKSIPLEDRDYETHLNSVYEKYLGPAVSDTLKISISQEVKVQAALALLGVNHSITHFSPKGNRATITHRLTPVNAGQLKLSCSINGLNPKKPFTQTIGSELMKNSKPLRQLVYLKDKAGKSLNGLLTFEWNGLKIQKPFTLNEIVGTPEKYVPLPFNTIHGPFEVSLLHASRNGQLLVKLPGETLLETSLMKSCKFTAQGKEQSLEKYLQKNGGIKPGTKVRFSYYNQGGNIFKPMCATLEILD